MDPRPRHGAGAHMGERPDFVVGAKVAVIALAGVDGAARLHHGVFQQGVGADDAPRAHHGLAPQDAPRQDHGAGGNLHLGVNPHVVAEELHPVFKMLFKGLCKRRFGGLIVLFGTGHGKTLPLNRCGRRLTHSAQAMQSGAQNREANIFPTFHPL